MSQPRSQQPTQASRLSLALMRAGTPALIASSVIGLGGALTAAVGAMQRGFHALRSRVQTAAQPLLRDHYTVLRNGRVVARITTATGYRSRARR